MLQPDYSKIFASGAAVGEVLNMPDESYLRGWGYLNASEPPPMEFFNYIMRGYDEKLYYLFDAANIRKNSTRYEVGDIVTTPNLRSGLFLVCKTAGTSDLTEPTWGDVAESVIDGSCRWEVRERLDAKTLDGKGLAYFETLAENGAKIKKVTFSTSSAAWSDYDGAKRLVITRNGFTCIAAFRVTGSTEEQVMAGIVMDSDNIYIHSLDEFDGYIIAVNFNK